MIVGVNNENANKGPVLLNGLGYNMRQLPVRDDAYIPINIPTVDKIITTTDLSWEEKRRHT
jgi:hypothetical protein